MKRKQPIVKGPQVKQLQRVGRRIASVVRMPHAKWEFVLFKDPKNPNAFALPGGKVGVYTGMLPITKNEAGLATVIAHEIARHGAERMSQSTLVEVGGSVLSGVLGGKSKATYDMAMQAYNLGTQVGVMLPYSRAQESEADHLGVLYMAQAGYDPQETVAFWQRFSAYNRKRGVGRQPEFLRTHPLDKTRIAQLRKLMPKALQDYKRAKSRR